MGSGEKVPSGGALPRPMSFIAGGDDAIFRRLSIREEPGLLRLRDVIREADVACVNFEASIREPSAYPVQQYSFASYQASEPWVAEELRWLGFNMACLGNNHMSDWSFETILTTQRVFREAGIECAGAGMTLTEAREPAYLDLPNGRVALISVESSWVHNELRSVLMASDPRGSIRGRPGLNGMTWHRSMEVDGEAMAALRRILDKVDDHVLHQADIPRAQAGELQFFGAWFRESDEFAIRTWCDERHMKDVLRWIDCAKSQSDYVLVSQHWHWADYGNPDRTPEHIKEFAHAAIDAGADIYVGTDAWVHGVEIYKQRPIFYMVGNLSWQAATQRRHPSDAYEHWGLDARATPHDFRETRKKVPVAIGGDSDTWRPHGFLAHATFEGSKLIGARVIPVLVDWDRRKKPHQIGVPLLAEGEIRSETLAYVAEASKAFGTKMDVESGEIDCGA